MEISKIDKTELKSYDNGKLKEFEVAVRRQLAGIKLEVYGEKGKKAGQVRSLKKSLARALTFAQQKKKSIQG
jgi:ribosomal protein L29